MVDAQGSDENGGGVAPPLDSTPREDNDYARIEKNEWGMGEHDTRAFSKLPETPAPEKKSDEEKSYERKSSSDVPPKRSTEKWNPEYEGTLASLAYVSSIATLWRFPEMILKHGGVFVLQYTLAYLAVGMPLLYAEMAIGQYTSCNHYGVFNHLAPILTGLGSCMTFILLLRTCVMSVIQSTTLAFLMATFNNEYYHEGNTTCLGVTHSPQCFNIAILNECLKNDTGLMEECHKLESVSLLSGAVQLRRTPFFDHLLTQFNVLPQSSSEFTWPHFHFIMSLLFVWILIAIICFLGTKALAKISYLMVIPIVTFLFFMIFAFYFISYSLEWAQLEKLHGVWTDAVSLVVFSLNLGNGGVIKLSSHNSFNHIFTRDVNIVSVYGYLFNYLTTLAILPYVYYLSIQIYDNDATSSMQLWVDHGDFGLMNVIAETIISRNGPAILCAMYFVACFILELESTSISMHVVYSTLLDRIYPDSRSILARITALIVLCGSAFLTSFVLIAPGGIYAIKELDRFFTIATLFTSFVQIFSFMHIYGFKRFIINVRTMTGGSGPVNKFWWISWIIFTPIVLLVAFIMECLYFAWEEISIGNVLLTDMFKNFSWIIFASCILWFPSAGIYRFVRSFRKNEKKKQLFKSTPEWGPADQRSREDAKFNERAMRVR